MKVVASILPILALALQGVSAAPTEANNIPVLIGRSADIILTVCDHDFFRGRCQDLRSQSQRCYNLGNGWADTITSAKSSSGSYCYLYADNNCSGKHLEMSGGGTGHQNLGWHDMNDKVSSYRCT